MLHFIPPHRLVRPLVLLMCMAILATGIFYAVPTAHAAGIPDVANAVSTVSGTTSTAKKIIPLSHALCAALQKRYSPQAAKTDGNCFISTTSTTTFISDVTMHSVHQQGIQSNTGCPGGAANHSYDFGVWFTFAQVFAGRMQETFSWHGNCSPPSVSGQRCTVQWTVFPVASSTIPYCSNWPDSNDNIIAEGDFYLAYFGGAGSYTHFAQSAANGRATMISDNMN